MDAMLRRVGLCSQPPEAGTESLLEVGNLERSRLSKTLAGEFPVRAKRNQANGTDLRIGFIMAVSIRPAMERAVHIRKAV